MYVYVIMQSLKLRYIDNNFGNVVIIRKSPNFIPRQQSWSYSIYYIIQCHALALGAGLFHTYSK